MNVLLVVFTLSVSFYILVRGDTYDDFINEKRQAILQEHNKFRSFHQVPELQLSEELNKEADETARKFARDPLGFQPNSDFPSIHGRSLWMAEGANISHIMTSDLNPVEDWYMERNAYPGFYNPQDFVKYGHFTQLIWKNTKRLGVALSSGYDKVMVVCVYDPKGNIPEEFAENVLPAMFTYEPSAVRSGNQKVFGSWIFVVSSVVPAFVWSR